MKDSILGPMVEVGAFGGFFFSRIQVHGLAFFERTSGGGIET